MTLDQWYDKIKSCLPKWYFEEEVIQKAVIYAWARIFYELETNISSHINETFISRAVEDFLIEHGTERSVEKTEGELESQYRTRIINITNKSNKPDLKSLVDQLLMVGECIISEDYESTLFVNREVFVNRGYLLIRPIKNTFSIIIDKQIHEPYAYTDREYFVGREDFVSTLESSASIFSLIVNTVNKAKAFGTLYRLIERNN